MDLSAPCVLVIGGHDPSGAGIAADIETCAALGCLALSVVTALTTQNTAGLHDIRPSAADAVRRQVELLAEDFPLAAVKVGMVPDATIAQALRTLHDGLLAGLPWVVDPLLRAGSGNALAGADMDLGWRRLLAGTTVATPNRAEALALAGTDDLDTAVATLLADGCTALLVTDIGDRDGQLVNALYHRGQPVVVEAMPRYPGDYHGSGCTLASAIACCLARGAPLEEAVREGQRFAHRAVARAHRPGSHQAIPNRAAAARP